jgi:hypothetical protein
VQKIENASGMGRAVGRSRLLPAAYRRSLATLESAQGTESVATTSFSQSFRLEIIGTSSRIVSF